MTALISSTITVSSSTHSIFPIEVADSPGKDFTQVVTLEKNWNLSVIPQPDGSGEGWDRWWLPFGMLRTANDPEACAYAPCYDYYNNKDSTHTTG